MTTDRSPRRVDANGRIVLTGGAVGLGLGLIGAMAWADGSMAAVDPSQSDAIPATVESSQSDAIPAAVDTGSRRIIVIMPNPAAGRAEVPAAAVPAPRQSAQAPVSRSQGS